MISFLRSPIAALVLLLGIVFWVNYHPGTFLTGWDNLHPEFHFSANIRRSFFSAWQEYKGTGVVEGQGLTADLPRQLVLWALSWILPTDALRWAFHFGMLLAGSIGIYLLMVRQVVSSYAPSIRRAAGMAAAVFYVFNLGTMQMFYVPFEPFSAHFGLMPWLFLTTLAFLKTGTRKSLWLFSIVSVLSIPQGAVVTVFLVYLMIIGLLCTAAVIHTGKWKRAVAVLFLSVAINGYWFFPTMYFGLRKSDENVSALNNIMSTETVLLKNKKYGTLENTLLLKGYLFDNIDVDPDGATSPQLAPWVTHLDRSGITWIGYFLFALSGLGIVAALAYRVSRAWYFLLPLVVSFSVLSNDAPVFSQLAGLFYRLPLFSQVFRFPFTKFSLATAFFLAVFYAIGCAVLLQAMSHRAGRRFVWLIYLAIPLIFCFPFFTGNLVYDKNQVVIPEEYFAVYEFFRLQPKNERIANFPQHTFWEWMHYRWNYSGAGILWFGIDQPILDRNWDSWGKENENYYHEISYAIYSKNPVLFSRVLEKYQVRWVLIDPNLISPSSAKESSVEQLETLVKSMQYIRLAATFGHIAIYRVDGYVNPQDFVYIADAPVVIEPTYEWNNYDRAYLDNRTYVSLPADGSGTIRGSFRRSYYPFRTLFTGRRESERAFVLEDHDDYYRLTSTIPPEYAGDTLIIPSVGVDERIKVNEDNPSERQMIAPQVFFNQKLLPLLSDEAASVSAEKTMQVRLDAKGPNVVEITVPKTGRTVTMNDMHPEECRYDTEHRSVIQQFTEQSEQLARFSTLNAIDCVSVYLSQLSHRRAYLIGVTSRNVQGQPLMFWLDNITIRRKDLEVYLGKNSAIHKEYYVQPPMDYYGMDYTLHFNNVSIGKQQSINDLGTIRIDPMPYRFLTSLRVTDTASSNVSTGNIQLGKVKHGNPSWYQIELSSQSITNDEEQRTETLVLSQSYDDGWKAYKISCRLSVVGCKLKTLLPFLFFQENKNHVLVNNWSNGWILHSEPTTILLVFLPQYLSYAGYGSLVAVLIFPLLYHRRRKV